MMTPMLSRRAFFGLAAAAPMAAKAAVADIVLAPRTAAGGVNRYALTIADIPSHSHGVTAPCHSHGFTTADRLTCTARRAIHMSDWRGSYGSYGS